MLLLEPNVSELKVFHNFYALENEQKKRRMSALMIFKRAIKDHVLQ